MPISSIPSPYGIGTFGEESYRFVDFLVQAGQKLWQILPLGPTGYGDSPYQAFSTFAGNPYYIDLELLVKAGYLKREECEVFDFGTDACDIDYEKIYRSRFKVLKKAFERAKEQGLLQQEEYVKFLNQNSYWLDDYALYMAVKDSFDGACFLEWESGIRLRKKAAVEKYQRELSEEIAFYQFQQYLFVTQWKTLKSYANQKGIEIVGDIPIYVALDSADTWANPQLFQLKKNGYPKAVAGCPPDVFAVTGQLWGNPLYDWKYHEKTGFKWWIQRIAYCYELYDVVRIDHFRGFDAYWSIPYGDPTAEKGHWEKGPGYVLFETLEKNLGKRKVIAEDLGFLTESVIRLVQKTGYPGMKIIQFAFDSDEENTYLPHNYERNCVVYTGTHDNDTTVGWVRNAEAKAVRYAVKYLNVSGKRELPEACVKAALSSVADTAIIPLQDYLKLGSAARINIPSTLGCNWRWRMKKGVLTKELAKQIKQWTKIYGRL